MLPFWCSAQSPLITGSGIDWTSGSTTGLADYTNNLYVDLETDTARSIGPYTQGQIVTEWTNIAPGNPSIGTPAFSAVTTSTVWPYLTNNVTPTGKPAVAFQLNDNSATQPKIAAPGSNQPVTVMFVSRMNVSQIQALFDCGSGSRTEITLNNSSTPARVGIFSGIGFNYQYANPPSLVQQYVLITCVLNGANSYVRTNGVLVSTGNPGTSGIGVATFGNDITFVTKLLGEVASFREYAEAPNTNNLHTAEQNQASRYLGITLPSP